MEQNFQDHIFLNMTGSRVVVKSSSGEAAIYEPSGSVAFADNPHMRVSEERGLRLSSIVPGEVLGIPPAMPGVLFIVSGRVFRASDRSDLISPFGEVRGDDGNIIHYKGFQVKPCLHQRSVERELVG